MACLTPGAVRCVRELLCVNVENVRLLCDPRGFYRLTPDPQPTRDPHNLGSPGNSWAKDPDGPNASRRLSLPSFRAPSRCRSALRATRRCRTQKTREWSSSATPPSVGSTRTPRLMLVGVAPRAKTTTCAPSARRSCPRQRTERRSSPTRTPTGRRRFRRRRRRRNSRARRRSAAALLMTTRRRRTRRTGMPCTRGAQPIARAIGTIVGGCDGRELDIRPR